MIDILVKDDSSRKALRHCSDDDSLCSCISQGFDHGHFLGRCVSRSVHLQNKSLQRDGLLGNKFKKNQ